MSEERNSSQDSGSVEFPPPVGSPVDSEPSGASNQGADPDVAHEYQRLCRHCSTQTVTASPDCPVCGKPYLHQSWFTPTKIIAIVASLAVIGLALGAVSFVRNRQAEQAAQAAAAQQAREQAEREAARQAAQERAEEKARAAILLREANVSGIEKSVTKMAREHASDGLIDGWPKSTSCSPVAGQSIDNLNRTTTKFSCFVTTERLGGGRARGHYYQALMNWDTGRYTYGYAD